MTDLTAVMNRGCDQRVFLHDYLASGARRDRVGFLGAAPEHQFAERALLLSQPQDVVIAPTPLHGAYLDYLSEASAEPLFAEVLAPSYSVSEGLASLTCAATVDTNFLRELASRLINPSRVSLSAYYPTAASESFRHALAQQAGFCIDHEGANPQSVDRANRKERAYSALVARGLGVAAGGLVARDPGESVTAMAARVCQRAKDIMAGDSGCIVRGCRSQSGLDALALHTTAELNSLPQWLEVRPNQTHYLVEKFVHASNSPNIQGWIAADGTAESLCIVTDQRIDKSSTHYGNSFPHDHALQPEFSDLLTKVTSWLSSDGYRGSVGIDLMTGGDIDRPMFAELNARINAATYFISLREKLNVARLRAGQQPLTAWLSHKRMPTRLRSFEQLRAATEDLLYVESKTEGCFPVASGVLPFGYVMLVTYANSVEEAARLEDEFRARVA